MKKQKTEKEVYHVCRKCNEELIVVTSLPDNSMQLQEGVQGQLMSLVFYCTNHKCELYGLLKIFG